MGIRRHSRLVDIPGMSMNMRRRSMYLVRVDCRAMNMARVSCINHCRRTGDGMYFSCIYMFSIYTSVVLMVDQLQGHTRELTFPARLYTYYQTIDRHHKRVLDLHLRPSPARRRKIAPLWSRFGVCTSNVSGATGSSRLRSRTQDPVNAIAQPCHPPPLPPRHNAPVRIWA